MNPRNAIYPYSLKKHIYSGSQMIGVWAGLLIELWETDISVKPAHTTLNLGVSRSNENRHTSSVIPISFSVKIVSTPKTLVTKRFKSF